MKGCDLQIGGHSSRQAVIERPSVVACGNEHTAAISSRGELFTWGLAGNGELGRVHWQPADAATPRAAHSLHCVRMVSVAAGANHTLAISEVPPAPPPPPPDRTPAEDSPAPSWAVSLWMAVQTALPNEACKGCRVRSRWRIPSFMLT